MKTEHSKKTNLSHKDLVDIFGDDVDERQLKRWRDYGWLDFNQNAPGSGNYVSYPWWTVKMIRLILKHGARNVGDHTRRIHISRLFMAVKEALRENPDVELLFVQGETFKVVPISSLTDGYSLGCTFPTHYYIVDFKELDVE